MGKTLGRFIVINPSICHGKPTSSPSTWLRGNPNDTPYRWSELVVDAGAARP